MTESDFANTPDSTHHEIHHRPNDEHSDEADPHDPHPTHEDDNQHHHPDTVRDKEIAMKRTNLKKVASLVLTTGVLMLCVNPPAGAFTLTPSGPYTFTGAEYPTELESAPAPSNFAPGSVNPGIDPAQPSFVPGSVNPGIDPAQPSFVPGSVNPGIDPAQPSFVPGSVNPGIDPAQPSFVPKGAVAS